MSNLRTRRLVRSSLVFVFALAAVSVQPLLAQGGYSIGGANAYVARHDWDGLLAYTRAWTRADPNDGMPWYYMGQDYGKELNRPADAAAAFRRAVALKPHWPEAWWALTITDLQTQRYSEALHAVNMAIEQCQARIEMSPCLTE